jgi:hypothetical protein
MNLLNVISGPYTKNVIAPPPPTLSLTVSTFAGNPVTGYLSGASMACSSDGRYVAYLSNSSGGAINTFRIFISSNYGVSYTVKLNDPPDAPSGGASSICMSDSGQYILAVTFGSFAIGTYTGRTYVSSDYGETWTSTLLSSSSTANTLGASKMTPDGRYMFIIGFAGNTTTYLCKSSDSGATFSRIYSSTSFRAPRCFGISSDGNYVHIANTWDGTVRSSSDGGLIFATTPNSTFTNISGVTSNTQNHSLCNSSRDGRYVYFSYVTEVAKVLYLYVNNNYGNSSSWSRKITYNFSLSPSYTSICVSNRIALLSLWTGGFNGAVYSVYSTDNFNTVNVDNNTDSVTNGFVYETVSNDGYNIYGYAIKTSTLTLTTFIRASIIY